MTIQNLTEATRERFNELAQQIEEEGRDLPMGDFTNQMKGYITNMKKAGLVTTYRCPGDPCRVLWIGLTEAGEELAAKTKEATKTIQALTNETRVLVIDADLGEIYSWHGSYEAKEWGFKSTIPGSDCGTVLLGEAVEVCERESIEILGAQREATGEIYIHVRTPDNQSYRRHHDHPTCACDSCISGRFESIPSTVLNA